MNFFINFYFLNIKVHRRKNLAVTEANQVQKITKEVIPLSAFNNGL